MSQAHVSLLIVDSTRATAPASRLPVARFPARAVFSAGAREGVELCLPVVFRAAPLALISPCCSRRWSAG